MTTSKENTIVQVICETAEVQSLRPYLRPTTKMNAGSGVIVDSAKGLIITNAHVTGNAQMIQVFSPITGKMPLRCELVSIIRDRDLSLIQIIEEDLKHLLKLKTPDQLDAKIIDHLTIPQGTQLFAAGFPLGTRLLQITSGCLSGLSTPDSFVRITQCEDSYARDTTFIATSAGLNFGMSGGGLFTEKGHLVGIITAGLPSANQIGFAIPSRIVYANYLLMTHNLLPRIPTFNFRWSNINQSTYDFLTEHETSDGGKKTRSNTASRKTPACRGILIRKILNDSVFHKVLQKKDLLYEIQFILPNVKEDSLKNAEKYIDDGILVSACIEAHGDITLREVESISKASTKVRSHDIGTMSSAALFDRKFSISEVSDYIPYGSPITVKFLRKGVEHEEKIDYTYKHTERIRGIYPLLENVHWMILGGICIQNITLNALAECPRYKYIDEISYYDEFLFRPSVIITHIFPSSVIGSLNLFNEGDILTNLNGKKVSSIKDVKHVMSQIGDTDKITVESDRGQFAVVRVGQDDNLGME